MPHFNDLCMKELSLYGTVLFSDFFYAQDGAKVQQIFYRTFITRMTQIFLDEF